MNRSSTSTLTLNTLIWSKSITWIRSKVKDYIPLSFCLQRRRACAPCALKETLAVSYLESQEKRVGWWRASVRAQDLQNSKATQQETIQKQNFLKSVRSQNKSKKKKSKPYPLCCWISVLPKRRKNTAYSYFTLDNVKVKALTYFFSLPTLQIPQRLDQCLLNVRGSYTITNNNLLNLASLYIKHDKTWLYSMQPNSLGDKTA